MKNFVDFFSINEDLNDEFKDKLTSDYKSLKKGVLELIDNTIDESDKISNLKNFFDNFLEEDIEDIELNGFIELNDIYEFYLKYQSDIDSILSDNEFYDKNLTELSIFSLYDYVIYGTRESVKLVIKELYDNLYENEN